ncbi:hypothetical protein PybrP1_006523 [[Pythium] brassicae (nom. inval.)]|nr:hypothetical protein PybrP1_006523 [[Pythium] brassicae (nom. inval.)]
MDLYADLPLAKGASSAALDADGKLKAGAGSSVWKAAPAFVPQSLRTAPPPVDTQAAAKSAEPKKAGVTLAFRPASVTRKSPKATAPVAFVAAAKTSAAAADGGAGDCSGPALNDAEPKPRGIGFGFAAVHTTTEVRKQAAAAARGGEENQQAAANVAGLFHSSYRDEYNPARPNSYEALCEERASRKKLEEVKKELDRRQREQEAEGKLEREKLVRDIEAGKAPTAELAAAGRGRGMTVPAWMRKKMEASASARQAEVPTSAAESANARVVTGQFEDAAPRAGLGFSSAVNRAESPSPLSADCAGLGATAYHRDVSAEPAAKGAGVLPAGRDVTKNCVILLQNMVGPGEVDDELQDEVKEECASKYGAVVKCVVHEVAARVAPEHAVRIFVQFQRPADAEKARQGLNARFFGGRKVQASYYDDDKFRRLDLAA